MNLKKKSAYQIGSEKLAYLQQLAEDDDKMVKTLNDFQIDALATQISLVISQYLDEAHHIKIDFKNIEAASRQSIWDQVTNDIWCHAIKANSLEISNIKIRISTYGCAWRDHRDGARSWRLLGNIVLLPTPLLETPCSDSEGMIFSRISIGLNPRLIFGS